MLFHFALTAEMLMYWDRARRLHGACDVDQRSAPSRRDADKHSFVQRYVSAQCSLVVFGVAHFMLPLTSGASHVRSFVRGVSWSESLGSWLRPWGHVPSGRVLACQQSQHTNTGCT